MKKKRFSPRVVTCVLLSVLALPALAVVADKATEADLKFSYFVDIEEAKPTKAEKKEAIEQQLMYMHGSMANSKYKGVPRGDHSTHITKTEKLKDGAGVRVHYDYSGRILLQSGPRKYDSFPLPRIPTEKGIYDPAVDEKTGINKATDEHYQDFSDYWYFWNPTNTNLLKKGEHYDIVKGNITREKNSQRTYPEYDRLKTGKIIRMSAFFGMDEPHRSHSVTRSRDLGADGYRGFKAGLIAEGYVCSPMSEAEKEKIMTGGRKEPLTEEEIEEAQERTSPYTVEQCVKETETGKIVVNVFFGETGIDESSRPFHFFYKDALEKSGVVLYDGHSGLGGHLDLGEIESAENFKIRKNPKKYQIMYFNSCTSYTYYNLTYHMLKGKRYKTQSLDILTNGLETAFDPQQKANLALVKAIGNYAETGKKESYQSLAKTMTDANLFIVSGDEDNPRR